MDDIQRKLALIDRQLAGGTNLHKQIVSTSPLALIAVGLITGILLQNKFEPPLILWFILLVLFAASTLIFFTLQKVVFNNKFIIAYMALFCFVCLGAIRLISFYQPRPNDIRNLVGNEKELATAFVPSSGRGENTKEKLKMDSRSPLMRGQVYPCESRGGNDRKSNDNNSSANSATSAVKENIRKLATIRGLIVTDPYINKNRQWKFAKFTFTDPTSSFYIKVKQLKTVSGWAKTTGTVRVQVDEPVLDLKAGDNIQAYCWLDRFKATTNPGQFNIAKYLARKNVFISASIKSRDGIKLLKSHPKGIFTKIKAKLREAATQALVGDLSLEDRSRGLLEALLLGYRGNIDSKTYEAFRKTGLLHFISLSGLHIGILVLIIWQLCRTVGLMRRSQAIVCITAIGILLLIVPHRAPIRRAAIICFVFCLSLFVRRHSNRLNTLSLAAIILLLIRPTALFNRGWQLSFSTVLGILFFTDNVENFVHEITGNWFWNTKSGDGKLLMRLTKRLGKAAIKLFSVGFAAWLGGAGIALYHFHTITPLTAVWTVLVFWTVAPILIVGFFKIILSFFLPSFAAVLGVIVNLLSDLLIWIVEHIASLDVSQILVGHVSLAVVVLYYGFLLFGVFAYFWGPLIKRPLLKNAIYTVMALSLIVLLGVVKWQRTYRDNLVLTCLDVSHGQAILAQLPGKTNVLFDAGSLYKSDIGRRIVAPFLDYSGINKIDAIIISHNDVDHINGIPEIVGHCKVRRVYANDAFINHPDPWGTAESLKTSLSENELRIETLGKKLNVDSKAKIKILWPTEQVCRNEELGDNDKSVVTLIEFAGRKILLCSDIEKFAQQELLRLFPSLKADIVVTPHHGLAKTLEGDLLKNLDAGILICSCGRSQYERMNRDPGPVNRDPNKAKSFYTARDGAIIVRIKKDGTTKIEVFVE